MPKPKTAFYFVEYSENLRSGSFAVIIGNLRPVIYVVRGAVSRCFTQMLSGTRTDLYIADIFADETLQVTKILLQNPLFAIGVIDTHGAIHPQRQLVN